MTIAAKAGPRIAIAIPALLIAAGSASILSTDLYAPSLPHLPAYFATDAATVKLTMSLNLAAFALAQLLHGPLADRYGRRPVFLAGMLAFVATALGAAAAQSVGQLILARVLMGAAASVEAVIVLAVIRDLYDEAGAVRLLALYGMVIAVAPAVGPVIGGFVFVWLGWRANFLLLAGVVALICALAARLLPETAPGLDRGALAPARMARGYLGLLANRVFVAYALMMAVALAGIFAFVTAAPFILITRHGVLTEHYGFFQAAIVAAYFIGTLLAGRSAGRLDTRQLCTIGIALMLAGAMALVAAVAWRESPLTITAATALFTAGLGPLFAAAPVLAMSAASTSGGGQVAALIGAFEMGGGALGAFAVGVAPTDSAWPLALTLAASALAAALALTATGIGRQRRTV